LPTILRSEGFHVRIYLREHPPAHVHVWKAGAWARIDLPTAESSAHVVSVRGMTTADVIRAVRIVEAHADSNCFQNFDVLLRSNSSKCNWRARPFAGTSWM
jgi:hypothetical protein